MPDETHEHTNDFPIIFRIDAGERFLCVCLAIKSVERAQMKRLLVSSERRHIGLLLLLEIDRISHVLSVRLTSKMFWPRKKETGAEQGDRRRRHVVTGWSCVCVCS